MVAKTATNEQEPNRPARQLVAAVSADRSPRRLPVNRTRKGRDKRPVGSRSYRNRIGVFSFNIKGIHPHDLSTILDKEGIAIRAGHHCTMPLHTLLKIPASSRVSLYLYNTKEEIDYFFEILKKAKEVFKSGKFLV